MDITVRDSINNTARQLLHIVSELSALFISKQCLQELGIISDSFPLLSSWVSLSMLSETQPAALLTHPRLHVDA